MTLPHDVKGLMAHITKKVCIYRQTFHISIYYTQLFVHNISFGQTENPYQFHASECLRVTISLSYIKENFHKNLLRTTMNYTGWPQVWVKKKNVQGRVATLITDERQTYRPRLPTAANTTITQTMIAARKRIMSTIMNAITATCTQQCKHTVHNVNNCN